MLENSKTRITDEPFLAYKHFPIKNLATLQQKVLEFFPREMLAENRLFYPNLEEHLLKIPELNEALIQIGGREFVHKMAFFILQPQAATKIHIDSGVRVHSLNIPIANGANTFVSFYKNKGEIKYEDINTEMSYWECSPDDCDLIGKIEMNEPYIINVKCPHQVHNLNSQTRITLLVRLRTEFSLEAFAKNREPRE